MKPAPNRAARWLWLVAEILCIAVLAVVVLMIIGRLTDRGAVSREEQASTRAMQAVEPADSPETTPEPEKPPVIQPAIAALQAQNPDAVGLLKFDADRSLYVCQGDDNYHYMYHQFDGTENPAGMIFMDYRNTLLPRSDNLILYGHNMRDGSRFGTLKRFTEAEYLLNHPIFTFADAYETVEYLPFAVFHTTVIEEDEAYFAFDRTDFADEAAFDAYIAEVKSRSVLDLPVEVNHGDKLLTLATCSSAHDRGRLVIVCKEK